MEIPIARNFIARWPKDARGLEIGNVLHHYGFSPPHVVVDKYERARGVLNLDVVDLDFAPFDWVIAISTLEHVGWDEPERDSGKAGRAIELLCGQLVAGGALLVTAPLGYNAGLDEFVREGIRPDAETFYRRDSSSSSGWAPMAREMVLAEPVGSHWRPGRVSTLWIAEFGAL